MGSVRRCWLAGQERQKICEFIAQLTAIDDEVERALFHQELGALESFRQFLAHRLLDHAGTGKADQCARFAITRSATKANDADTPPIVGSVRSETNGSRALVSS